MNFKRLLLLITLVIGLGTTAGLAFAKTEAVEENANYEIYPTPKNVEYSNKHFDIKEDINIVVDDGIDQATRDRAEDVFETKGKVEFSNSKVEGKTNVYVGTTQSLETEKTPASDYIEATYNNEIKGLDFKDKIDPYYLGVFEDEFVVYGQNTNAAFYGLTTLMHVFNQIDNNIQSFDVYDYADTPIRGFIEGYYGIPWTVEDRISLMEFGGQFKMTSYIFAPKDDPYHKNLWREEYPEDLLKDMERMAEVGNATKTRFVWTAHPFMGGFNQKEPEKEIQALLNKFDQLYSVGVRQFGVLGDDVGNLPREIVVDMMNAVVEWGNEKTKQNPNDPVYDPVFCPGGYNHSWQGNYSEISQYDKEFSEQVNIFWTGEAVCEPVEQKTLDHFRTYKLEENGYTEGQERRAPLFWLNWPVNDVNQSRMVMGRGEQLHIDVNPEDLAGVVTNPMQEAEASKVALFAVADYAWNVAGFDMQKSWEDSFKYIDKDAAEELHTLAKHMSDPAPNNHGITQSESEELKPYLDAFKEACQNNNNELIQTTGADLIEQMEIIIDACEQFHIKSKNENLKDELLPFTNALSDMADSVIMYVNAKLALINGDGSTAVRYYIDGNMYYATSKDYTKPKFGGGVHIAKPGSKRIQPFMDWIKEYLSAPISSIVGGDDRLVITAEQHFGNFTEYNGNKLSNTVDGKNDTFFWNGAYIQAGDYIQFKFNKPTDVYGIHILTGKNDDASETFYKAKIKVFTVENPDGFYLEQTFDNYTQNIHVYNLNYKNVTAINFEQYGEVTPSGNPKWFAMREFWVDQEPVDAPVNASIYRTTENWGVGSGNENNILDNNPETTVHYAVRNGQGIENRDTMMPGDFIGLEFDRVIDLGTIIIRQGRNDSDGDFMKKAVLEYSIDGTEDSWKTLGTYENQRNITLDFNNDSEQHLAKYIRLRITEKQNNWLGMRDFVVTEKITYNAKANTNVNGLEIDARVLSDNASLKATDNITLKNGQYIGLELKSMSYLDTFTVNATSKAEKTLLEGLTLEVSTDGINWEAYEAGSMQSVKFVRAINNTENELNFDLEEFSVTTFEYENIHIEKYNGFKNGEGNLANLFDNDRNTKFQFEGNQVDGSYVIIDLGREIHFDSFKVVLSDSEWDFPRHAKFSLSATADGEWNDILFIGDQEKPNPGEENNEDNILDIFDHETSYATKSVEGLDINARYIKFEITMTKKGNSKWVRFNEFEINGEGLYLPDAHPSFISDANDTRGHGFNNMIDGDISTSFKPAEETGSFTYLMSNLHKEYTQVKLIRNASLGTSDVKAYAVTAEGKEIYLGDLNTTLNVFRLPEEKIVSIKVTWENTPIEIYEVLVMGGLCTGELENLIRENLNKDDYIASTWTAYEEALNAAKDKDLTQLSQEEIDSLANAIKAAREKLVKRGDTTKLDELLNEGLNEADYTAESWAPYKDALEAAKNADTENMTQEQIDALVKAIEDAKANLVKVSEPVDPTEPENGGLSGGAITGIVFGTIAGIALLGGAIYLVMRKRNNK